MYSQKGTIYSLEGIVENGNDNNDKKARRQTGAF